MIDIPKNFTPGPWRVAETAANAKAVFVKDDVGGVALATMQGVLLSPNRDANAALIALAPQMAAELLTLRADVQRLTDALAAAEGEGFAAGVEAAAKCCDDAVAAMALTAQATGGETLVGSYAGGMAADLADVIRALTGAAS